MPHVRICAGALDNRRPYPIPKREGPFRRLGSSWYTVLR